MSFGVGSAYSQSNNGSPRELYQQAIDQYWGEQYVRAEALFWQFLIDHPDHNLYWDAKYGLAQTLLKQGKLEQSRKLFNEVRRNHPDKSIRGDALFGLIEVAILQDQTILARNLLQTFTELYPDHMLRPAVEKRLQLLKSSAGQPTAATREAGGRSDRSRPTTSNTEEKEPPSTESRDDKKKSAPSDEEIIESPPLRFGGENNQNKRKPIPTDSYELIEESPEQAPKRPGQQGGADMTKNGPQTPTKKTPDDIDQLRREIEALKEANRELMDKVDRGRNRHTGTTNQSEGTPEVNYDSPAMVHSTVRQLINMGEYNKAWNVLKPLINMNPDPRTSYQAALVGNQLNHPFNQTLQRINQAMDQVDPVPEKYILLKGEVLIEEGEGQKFDSLYSQWNDRFFRSENPESIARWHLLRGKRLIQADQTDEAFFALMEAVKSAPESSWGQEARKLIRTRL